MFQNESLHSHKTTKNLILLVFIFSFLGLANIGCGPGFQVKSGDQTMNSTGASSPTPVAICHGAVPTDANLCPGDDTGLTNNANRLVVNACTNSVKCEYTCATNYQNVGGVCQLIPATYACQGVVPTDANLCPGDDADLTNNANRVVVNACTASVKCEYTCATNYFNASGVCSACTGSPVLTQPLNCPAGQTGSITQTRTVLTTTCPATGQYAFTYSDWTTVSNTCATPPPPPIATSSVVIALGNATPLNDAQFSLYPILNPPPTDGTQPFGNFGFTLGINSAVTETFLFTPFDIAMIETATGTGQEAAFLQAVKDAYDINNGGQTLAQLGITASVGPAFNYSDQIGEVRSVSSVLLTGAAGITLSSGTFIIKDSTNNTLKWLNSLFPLTIPGEYITIGFLPPGNLGKFDIEAISMYVNGVLTVFTFQNADFASIKAATSFADQERVFEHAILDAYNQASPTHATLTSLGFTLIQDTAFTYQLAGPAGTTLTGGEWFFTTVTQGAEPIISN